MALFRKRPVVVEAVRYEGTNAVAIAEFIGDEVNFKDGKIVIETLEGAMTAGVGDWIIRGVKGELYPCRDDIFRATYEPAGA